MAGAAGAKDDARWPPVGGGTWVLDLDGVIWLQGQPLAGVDRAVATLQQRGVRTLYATNNSATTVDEVLARLARAGIRADSGDVVSSAAAAAGLLAKGSRALVLGSAGLLEALAARGVEVVSDPPADAVVVGWTREFDFDRLAVASRTVRQGARLIGTNDDATYPTPDGLIPGAGSLLAAVATASGTFPEVAGKPHRAMAQLIGARVDDVRVVVGDRPSTDGLFARQLGVPFALVFSGVTAPGTHVSDPRPAVTAPDLAALVTSISKGPPEPVVATPPDGRLRP